MRKVLSAIFGILLAAVPAAAQDKPLDINFGFGWVFPTSDLKKDFDAGWTGTIGVTFNINEKLGFMADYSYDHMNGPSRTVPIASAPGLAAATNGVIDSNHQMHVGTFDLVYKAKNRDHPIGGYVLGGLGIYHRIVQLTSPAIGYTTICDPYWYVCYPAAVSVDQILGDRSSNDFGINFGGAITFGKEGKFYVESRYHYVWGKDIKTAQQPIAGAPATACSDGCTTNAAYFPLIFGFRW